jgi:hypothetical protein
MKDKKLPKKLPKKTPKNNKKIIIDINKLENISNNNKFLNTILNTNFIIKNDKINIECKCKKYKNIYEISSTNKDQKAFYLIFGDQHRSKSNNTVYIEQIHKTPSLSGSSIIKTVTKFITKFINIKQIILMDDSKIECNKSISSYSLTLFSLITTKKTFYGKYGFEFYTNKNYEDELNNIIDKCANVKLIDILKELNLLLTHLLFNINIKNSQTDKFQSDYINYNDFYPNLIGIINILQNIKKKNITFKDLLLKLKKNRQCRKVSLILAGIKKISYSIKFSDKQPFLYNISKMLDIIYSNFYSIYYT